MTQPEIDLQKILNGIQYLMQVRSQLLESELSPEGAWIHEYEVKKRYPSGFLGIYRYAKWQAEKPIFKRNPKKRGRLPKKGKDPKFTCHQHIGRVWSNTDLGTEPEVEEAYQALINRKRLDAVETALQEIQSILSRFERSANVMPLETNQGITSDVGLTDSKDGEMSPNV